MAECCNASQDAQDAWDAENTSLASGRNADRSDAGSVFADVEEAPMDQFYTWTFGHDEIIDLFPISFGRMCNGGTL